MNVLKKAFTNLQAVLVTAAKQNWQWSKISLWRKFRPFLFKGNPARLCQLKHQAGEQSGSVCLLRFAFFGQIKECSIRQIGH